MTRLKPHTAQGTPEAPESRELPLSEITDAISRLRFGSVVLTVHDGKLVQMEVTERQRFT